MIKFAICDDEPYMLNEISGRISGYMKEIAYPSYQIRTYGSGGQLFEGGCDFDILFLDIRMGAPDGMETARKLREQKNRCLLIFVTVLKEPVFRAFEVEAFGYLVKPFDDEDFRKTLARAINAFSQKSARSILVRKADSCEKIPLSDLLYCEVLGRKIYLHRTDGTVTDYYGRLEALQETVDARFFRCHRSYLVNLDYVRGCGAGAVTLSQGGTVPLSRLRRADFMQAMLRHMKERGS